MKLVSDSDLLKVWRATLYEDIQLVDFRHQMS